MSYTKGPWHVEDASGIGGYPSRLGVFATDRNGWNDCGREICRVEDAEEEDKANLALIAAAPDLIEVLQDAERLMSFLHWDADGGRKDKFNILVRVRAAIAKAEGTSR